MSTAREKPRIAESETSPEEGGPGAERVLVRLSGDLTTKAKATRAYFVRRLTRNLRDALRAHGLPARVERGHDRLLIEAEAPRAARVAARVFGVQSVSPVTTRGWHSEVDLADAGFELFAEVVRGRRFAVRARRVGDRKRIALDSHALERDLGARLLPLSAGVDLSRPEVTAAIEVTADRAHFFAEQLTGPGGLPIGVEGRAVALVSGGFDSAVAVWLMLKRGVAIDYVFCNLGGRSHQLGTLRVMQQVARCWSYGTRPNLHAIDFDAVSRDLREKVRPRLWQVVLKRLMYAAAEQVAGEVGAEAIVTGEALGQVSSQTLTNLAVISRASELPVLRPLLGFNKDEILEIARHIGTYDLSKVVGEYCAMVPRKPATAARLNEVEAEESQLDRSLLARAVAARGRFDLRRLDVATLDDPALEASGIPDDAVVLDLRTLPAYRSWHYPGALFLDFPRALQTYRGFERGRPYVLYCEFGLKSAHLAELMRSDGFDARHFRGGLSRVISLARERGLPTPDAG